MATINAGGQKSRGVEVLASYQLTSALRVSGSYTFDDSEYLGTGDAGLDANSGIVAGNQVYGGPETFYSLSVDYMGEAMSSGLSLRHIGDRYINFENSASAPAYEVVDAYIGADFTDVAPQLKEVHVRLNVNNLLDREYIIGVGTNSVYPGSPRTVTLTVGADF